MLQIFSTLRQKVIFGLQSLCVAKLRNSMDIYSIFTLIGGLAFFLYGISVMSQGLEKTASGKLEQLLNYYGIEFDIFFENI